jgi:hypothetical protein
LASGVYNNGRLLDEKSAQTARERLNKLLVTLLIGDTTMYVRRGGNNGGHTQNDDHPERTPVLGKSSHRENFAGNCLGHTFGGTEQTSIQNPPLAYPT